MLDHVLWFWVLGLSAGGQVVNNGGQKISLNFSKRQCLMTKVGVFLTLSLLWIMSLKLLPEGGGVYSAPKIPSLH